MKKLFLCTTILTISSLSYQITSAKGVANNVGNTPSVSDISTYIATVYKQIDFSKTSVLSYDVFEKGYKGYLNLKTAGKLNNTKELLTIVDLSQSSTKKRLWIIDLKEKKVLINDYVAHGQGSGDEFATVFSNTENSHQSSIGFYVTGAIYNGEHGASLRLHGMDNGYNSAAYDRAIVIHGADYVCPDFIKSQNRLGRSWGCPAVSNQIAKTMINTVNNGTCLFIYYPHKKYLASAFWLNKKIDYLPEQRMLQDMLAMNTATKKDTVYVYDQSVAGLDPNFASTFDFSFISKVLP